MISGFVHAVYQYAYSHKIHHPRLSGITGRYVYRKVENCARAEKYDGDTIIAYCPSKAVWLITSANSFITVSYNSASSRQYIYASRTDPVRRLIDGVYYSHNTIDTAAKFQKTTHSDDGSTITYSPTPRDSDTWNISTNNSPNVAGFDMSYPADSTSTTQFVTQLSRFIVKVYADPSLLPADAVDQLLQSPVVMFYKYTSDCKNIPTDWETAPNWIGNPYFDDPPVVVPFEPTPTPSPTYSPTPTPSPTVSPQIGRASCRERV